MKNPRPEKRVHIIQNRIMTFISTQPRSSKWWWRGAILNTRFLNILNHITCIITERVSSTNNPPIINSSISCFKTIATAAIKPPRPNEPVSPMKISAGAVFHHKKAAHDAIVAPHITAMSIPNETLEIVHSRNAIKQKIAKTIDAVPAARPSSPSVKFTALVVEMMIIAGII